MTAAEEVATLVRRWAAQGNGAGCVVQFGEEGLDAPEIVDLAVVAVTTALGATIIEIRLAGPAREERYCDQPIRSVWSHEILTAGGRPSDDAIECALARAVFRATTMPGTFHPALVLEVEAQGL